MRSPFRSFAFFVSIACVLASAAAPRPEIAALFRPFETDLVTLSADGRYLAYTQRRGDELLLMLRDLEANTVKSVPLAAAKAEELSGDREKTPARITFLRWAADDRLVLNLNARNVWSIRADGTDARMLGNTMTYAPPPPDNQVTILGSSSSGAGDSMVATVVTPQSTLLAVDQLAQPVNIASMVRGDRHVFIEALDYERGVRPVVRTIDNMPALSFVSTGQGTPRVVLRVDPETGRQDEWAETPNSLFLLSDQQGYPRILLERENRETNSRGLGMRYSYAAAKRNRWTPLDELTVKLKLAFHDRPELRLGERSVPIEFDHDGRRLYFASNVGRDTYGIYALDTKTWQRTDIAIEPAVDAIRPTATEPPRDTLVFDPWKKTVAGLRCVALERMTLWFDPELAKVQRTLGAGLAGKTVEILEWDEARERFLVRTSSGSRPAAYHVFDRAKNRLDELFSIAPWLAAESAHPTTSFGFQAADGANITCYLTLPRRTRLKRPPLLALLHDAPGARDWPGFDREAQALATMGFAVVQVNYRGSAGFGRKQLDALRAAPDTAPIDDILGAIERVVRGNKIDPRFIGLVGRGYGGYLALRALQLHPQRFRCAVTLDAPTDLPTWTNPPSVGRSVAGELRRAFLGSAPRAQLEAISPLAAPEKITVPVMLIEREGDTTTRAADLHRALQKLERESVHRVLGPDEAADLPGARAALFAEIEEFLNTYVYNYAVKLGEAVEKDTTLAPPVAAPRIERPTIETTPAPELSRPKPKLDESKP